LIVTGIEDT